MESIISRIYELLKETDSLIEFEEQLNLYIQDLVSSLVGDVLSHVNRVVKEEKQAKGWKVERNDERNIQFIFGNVQFKRTLMYDENGQARYPLDELLGFRKYQRYSRFVEVKAAELASENTYRESARILNELTAIQVSHTTVQDMVKRVGKAQAEADQKLVEELEEAASLPVGKKVDFLYAEADGVFVRDLQKGKHIEVSHGMTYEGWDKNGNRVSLKQPQVIMTTQSIDQFWDEMKSITAHKY